jgi:hypothetical protein
VGRFVTQGAGDIVQSALFKTGVVLINRRDMGTSALESQWGLLDLAEQRSVNFVVTGSVNSLDFIPGGGFSANIGGVEAKKRQFRVMVGFDLAMTNVRTGRIVANIALRKQISADENGFILGRIFDETVVDVEIGNVRREAVNHALRQMLQLGTYELLTQMMPAKTYRSCSELIDERYGKVTGTMTGGGQLQNLLDKEAERERIREEKRLAKEAKAAAAAEAAAVKAEEQAAAASTAPAGTTDPVVRAKPVPKKVATAAKKEPADPVVSGAETALKKTEIKEEPLASSAAEPVKKCPTGVPEVSGCAKTAEGGT